MPLWNNLASLSKSILNKRDCDAASDSQSADALPEFDLLEDRVLFSASPVPVEMIDAPAEPIDDAGGLADLFTEIAFSQPETDDSMTEDVASESDDDLPELSPDIASESATLHELVVIDPSAENYDQLVADLLSQETDERRFDILVLDPARDGMDQITEALAQFDQLDALHIVSHGSDGAVKLGDSWLTLDNVGAYAGQLVGWRDALSDGADLMVYGCELASGEDGQLLIESLSALTGADVAASTDLTGSAERGGDWDFEFNLGEVTTDVAFSEFVREHWTGLLATATFQEGTGGYTGTQDVELWEDDPGATLGTDDEITIDTNNSGGESQGLIRFDSIFGNGAGQIPLGSTINTATLTLEATNQSSSSANITFHQMLASWDETDTWNSMGSGIQIDDAEASTTIDGTVQNPNLTGAKTISGLEATVQAWSDGATNYGWAIVSDHSNGWDFYSSERSTTSVRPILTIDYTPPTHDISGTVFEDSTGNLLSGGESIGDTDNPGASGVTVNLYQDGGDGLPGGDTLIASTTTDANGDYTFSGLSDDTYFVVIDSTTITPSDGFNSSFGQTDVWAEQTYGSAGSVTYAGGSYSFSGSAGTMYGGKQIDVSDDLSSSATAEHITRVTLNGSDVSGVDSGFSFDVVTRTGDGDDDLSNNRTVQGSLRQFIQNSNAISGVNSSQFAISTNDANYNLSGNGEFTIQPTSALPIITDAVVLDGTTQSGFSGNPIIEIDGSLAGASVNGLSISAGSSTVTGFVINQFSDNGILITGGAGNTIAGNYIGTDVTGTLDRGNGGDGIDVQSNNNTIGGTTSAVRNIISGNTDDGIDLDTASGSIIQGNYIGTDVTGTIAIGNNSDGILIDGSSSNTIGGTSPGARNVIAGNGSNGINFASAGSTSNTVQGNYIGVDSTGNSALANYTGIAMAANAGSNTIGGTSTGAGNVISGNTDNGLFIQSDANEIYGNIVGLNAAGDTIIGNGDDGIEIRGANNIIGGATSGHRNVISGNGDDGIVINTVTAIGNIVQGNYIGTDITGMTALANGDGGILVRIDATGTTIGGTAAGQGNVISGNTRYGINLDGPTSGATIDGNLIGVGSDGSTALGNVGDGILIEGGATGNNIGSAAVGNTIANNTDDGIAILDSSSTGNAIYGNSIHSNGDLGIDLGDDGMTSNDIGDGDSGPNDLQNFPVLSAVLTDGTGSATISGLINSTPNTNLRIQFYASSAGGGEGERYLGAVSVTTDASGNFSINQTLAATVAAGEYITATATNPADSTSEFSVAVTAEVAPVLDLDADDSSGQTGADFSATFNEGGGAVAIIDSDATLSDADSASLTSLTVTITNLLDGASEVLAADTSGTSITASYAAGVLTLSGSDTVSNYQQVLRTITYDNSASSPNTTARSISFVANDGTNDSNTGTTTLSIVDNSEPVIDLDADDSSGATGSEFSTTFNEDGGPVAIADADAIITDVDSANLTSLTVSISNLLDGTDEVLAADTSGTSITSSYDSATGVLTLTGADTVANYQHVLRTVTYDNDSNIPDTTDRVIVFVASDGIDSSDNAATTVAINSVNDAPTLDLDADDSSGQAGAGFSAAFSEGGGPVSISDSDATLGDVDSVNLNSLTVTITNLLDGADEVLAADTSGTSITASYAGGILTLSGSDSVANYQQVLRSITYDNPSSNPDTTDRSITFVANDGTDDSNIGTTTLTMTASNDAPVLDLDADDSSGQSGAGFAAAFAEDGGPVSIADADAALNDVDSANLNSLTVTITNLLDGADEALAANTSGTSITASYAGGVLTLGGSDSVANYEQVLRTITYDNASQNPDTTDRAITFVANDGTDDSNVANTTVSMTAVNDAPVATITPTGYGVNEDDGPRALGGVSVSDVDAGSNDLSISLAVSDGDLNLSTTTGLTFVGGANGSPTMTFTGNLTDVNNALATLSYQPHSNFYGTDNFSLLVDDLGNTGGGSLTHSDSATITVSSVNDAAMLDLDADDSSGQAGADFTATFSEGGGAVAIADADATLSDIDSTNLTSLAVTITNLLDGADELMAADTTGTSITASYAGGVLTLSGSDSVANYQQVLRTITYDNASSNPDITDRSITFVANDGTDDSNIGTTTLTMTASNDAPVLNLDADDSSGQSGAGFAAAFAEDGGPVSIADADAALNDVDSANLNSLTVTITNLLDGADEALAANTSGTSITASYAGGVLTLGGSDSVANYEQVLRTITYDNASQNPDTTDRAITFVANDGTDDSNVANTTVSMTAVNDAPLNSIPESQSTNEDTALVFNAANGNQISVSDVDADTGELTIKLDGTNGALTLNGTTGLSFTSGDGTDDVTMTFTGTVADVNAALDGLSFDPASNYNGPAAITIETDDQGNTGTGGVKADIDTIGITVSSVNDIPTTIGIPNVTVDEDAADSVIDLFAAFDDIEDPDPSLTFSISGNTDPSLFNSNAIDPVAGTLTFDFAQDQFGTSDITVRATDTNNDYVETTFTVTVNPVNDSPILANNVMTISEGETVTLSSSEVSATDVDDSAASLTFAVSNVSGGQFERISNPGVAITNFVQSEVALGDVVFIHDGEEAAPTYDIEVRDASLTDGPYAAAINFTNINDAPTGSSANFDSNNVEQLVVGTPGLLTGASDAENDPLSALLVSAPSHGTISLNADGSFTYEPDPNYVGDDTFSFIVDDGQASSATQTVAISIEAAGGPPDPGAGEQPGGGTSTDPLPSEQHPDGDEPTGVTYSERPTNSSALDSPEIRSYRESTSVNVAALTILSLNLPDAFDLVEVLDAVPFKALSNDPERAVEQLAEAASSTLHYVLDTGLLWGELDALRDELESGDDLEDLMAGSAMVAAAAFSAGFVFWVMRGSYLLTLMLSAMPAWRYFDPLPILDREKKPKKQKSQQSADNDFFSDLKGGQLARAAV
jgi:hypothetical protein